LVGWLGKIRRQLTEVYRDINKDTFIVSAPPNPESPFPKDSVVPPFDKYRHANTPLIQPKFEVRGFLQYKQANNGTGT